jgi:hypothetical protein
MCVQFKVRQSCSRLRKKRQVLRTTLTCLNPTSQGRIEAWATLAAAQGTKGGGTKERTYCTFPIAVLQISRLSPTRGAQSGNLAQGTRNHRSASATSYHNFLRFCPVDVFSDNFSWKPNFKLKPSQLN